MLNMKSAISLAATTRVLAFTALSAVPFAASAAPGDAANADLARLKEGNLRFAAAATTRGALDSERRTATAEGQRPFAIIVGCADSRTAPELIFDKSIGDLFVVRTAGNLVDDHALGSIEFAVSALGARLIVVLGHTRCGAVDAARGGTAAPGHISGILRAIRPAAEASKGMPGDPLENAIRENARLVAEQIRKKAELGALASEVRIVSATYRLDTGAIEWAASAK